MIELITKDQYQQAQKFKKLYSLYQQNQDLISVGAYRKGSNPEIDLAIQKQPQLMSFLSQAIDERFDFSQSLLALKKALS